MIVRIDVCQHLTSNPYWQLARCRVQRGGFMEDVINTVSFNTIRFNRLKAAVRHAKTVTFAYLEAKRHADMPDTIEWRVYENDRIVLCSLCRQHMFRKVKLGRRSNCLDLKEWGCSGCPRPVRVHPAEAHVSAPVGPSEDADRLDRRWKALMRMGS